MVTLDPLSLAIGHAHQEGTPNSDMDFATSPVIFHDARGRALVGAVHKNGILYAYALNDVGAGAVWQRDVGGMVGLLPAYDPAAGEGGTVFAVGARVHALDPTTGAERWVSPGLGLPWSNLAIANGLIFVNTGG